MLGHLPSFGSTTWRAMIVPFSPSSTQVGAGSPVLSAPVVACAHPANVNTPTTNRNRRRCFILPPMTLGVACLKHTKTTKPAFPDGGIVLTRRDKLQGPVIEAVFYYEKSTIEHYCYRACGVFCCAQLLVAGVSRANLTLGSQHILSW